MGHLEKPGVDMRRLRYFVAVCDHGGFSKAAANIGVAQPALTRQVQLLEQELGVVLMTRNGRGAEPSNAGRVLLKEARAHLEDLDQLVARVRRDYAPGPAQVSLGICPTITPLFLKDLTEKLALGALPVNLTVIEAYSGDLRSLMASGRLDLAISYRPEDATAASAIDLLTERLVLVGPLGAGSDPISLHNVTQLRLILPSSIHQLRRIIDSVALARGLTLTPALELDSLSAVKAMLDDPLAGLCTILPFHSVRDDAARSRFSVRLIDDPAMVRTIALLQPAEAHRRIPARLTEQILARAQEIRATLEAVT